MGVPGFFLWLWKNYKKSNFVFSKIKVPEGEKINDIDWLLLDMNCMIHPMCFETLHDIHDKIKDNTKVDRQRLENKMIRNVISYLEKMITIANPQKGIYVAVDGVAPVAKMKQQRLRRYKHISDTELHNNIRKKHNKEIPYYWSNSSITPGTEFMQNITSSLRGWAEEYSKKHKIKIIFSPASVPGEGEHKLLQHIRNTNEELKYAVYGLDADLIFLMLATQKNNIYLMREANKMDEKNDGINFISITKMKECIVNSIRDIILKLKDETLKGLNNYNTDRIVDDFIFICSLMGNDFLPHMPSLDIYENAIDTLMQTYVEIVICNNTFIVDRNTKHYIDNNVFYDFLVRLASMEETTLKLAFGKKKRFHTCQSSDPFDIEMHRIDNMMFKVKDPVMIGSDNITDWTTRYYKHYYKVEPAEMCGPMTKHYMIGLKWVIMYYLNKCPSWDWYYTYDHAPFLTDMVRDKTIIDEVFTELVFTEGNPLSPFEQLLTILPKQSSYLLPVPLRKIPNNINGSAAHLYPTKFDLDMIGKRKYWMCTPILPKLEINLIRKIFEKYSKLLPSDLRLLNQIGEVFEY